MAPLNSIPPDLVPRCILVVDLAHGPSDAMLLAAWFSSRVRDRSGAHTGGRWRSGSE
jgi:hypothetical protein